MTLNESPSADQVEQTLRADLQRTRALALRQAHDLVNRTASLLAELEGDPDEHPSPTTGALLHADAAALQQHLSDWTHLRDTLRTVRALRRAGVARTRE